MRPSILIVLIAIPLLAQRSAKLEFEVASIKAAAPLNGNGTPRGGPGTTMKLSQDRAEANDRESFDRKQARHPLGRHAMAAHAGKTHLPAGTLLECPHQ